MASEQYRPTPGIEDNSLRSGTGFNADLQRHGYHEVKINDVAREKREAQEYESGKAGTDAAALELIKNRDNANASTEEIASQRTIERKSYLPDNAAMTPETAAELLKAQRAEDAGDVASLVDATDDQDTRDEIDRLRNVPTDAERQAQAQERAAERQRDAQLAEQVTAERQAREAQAAEVAAVQSRNAGRQAVLALNAEFPQLAQMDLGQLEAALPGLHQHENPAVRRAAQLAQTALDHGKAAHQHATTRATHDYNNYAAAQDEAFAKAIAHHSTEQQKAVIAKVPDALRSLGYDANAVLQEGTRNTDMGRAIRSAGFQRMVYNMAMGMVPADVLLRGKRHVEVPPVVRSGGRVDGPSYIEQNTARRDNGNRTFSTSNAGLRAAAAALANRRGR